MFPTGSTSRRLAVVLMCIAGRAWTAGAVPAAQEYSQAADQHAAEAMEAARSQVDVARGQNPPAQLQLTDALVQFGDAALKYGEYGAAETAYTEALQLAQRHLQANVAKAFGPQRGLGFVFAKTGRHEEAVPHLERALTIARAAYGVFDPRQQDVLRQLATSLSSTGRVADGEDAVLYMLRVAEKSYGEGDPRVVPAFCAAAEWFSAVGNLRGARMTYYVALNIVAGSVGVDDIAAVAPLRGLADTFTRELSYPAKSREANLPARVNTIRVSQPNSKKLNLEGEHALQRALQILEAHPQSDPRVLIDTLIQMGDWLQIKASREALLFYQRAWQLGAAEPSQLAQLSLPVRVYYPAPQIVLQSPIGQLQQIEPHFVQVEFSVLADGSVADARVAEHDTTERYATDVLEAVSAARFRPRFVDGQPVATAALSYREVFRFAPMMVRKGK